MRIDRIALRDFRGVEELDVTFDPAGVTVVEGRNEIGKTSIADAFMILLDKKDSAGDREIKAAQPIGRDVGPFAEAEMTVGPYRLVYRKQWLKGKKTELEITAPKAEQHAGEAAHNRMLEILDAETDPALFRALRYQQGIAISQAALGQAPSLADALDAAAGGTGSAGAAEQDALFEKVTHERQKYFTGTGGIPIGRKAKHDQLKDLSVAVAEAEEKIRKLEETVERQRSVERELIELRAAIPEVAELVKETTQAVIAIEEVERRVERALNEREKLESALREATAARDARTRLAETAVTAAEALAALAADIAAGAPALDAAKVAVERAQTARETARVALAAAELDATARASVVELLDRRLERDQLGERHASVVTADETIATAEAFLAGCLVDDKLLKKIDAAASSLAIAQGRAEAGKPRLVVEALKSVELVVNGESRAAEPGEPVEEVVSGEIEVVIGDVARVSVLRPASTSDADDDLAEADTKFSALLDAGGVASHSEAGELARERAVRTTQRDNAKKERTAALRDLGPAELAAKLGRAQERVVTLEAVHDPATETATVEEARALLNDANESVDKAKNVENGCQTDVEAAESALRIFEDRGIEQQTRLASAQAETDRSARELEEQRAADADDALEGAVADAAKRLVAAVAECDEADKALAAGDPGSARALRDNAQARQQRLLDDIRARDIETAGNRATLDAAGHEGLSDRRAEALARREDLERDVESENRRAAAVERLYDVLSKKREAAQQTIVGPFRDKVNAYARILYGPEVDVAIHHRTFEVETRTLNGTTVPYAGLSGGAREQLAVLARLACAALVSPPGADGTPGGVPVIIDDALGYSDPDRLEKLGAAFSVAGKDCQVIVLTCEPGRYRGIGGARVVSLG